MDVYYGNFNILHTDNNKIEFNIIGHPEVFTATTELSQINSPIYLGDINLEDQLLYKKLDEDQTFYIYVKDTGIYGVNISVANEFDAQSVTGSFPLEINRESKVVSIKQTSPLGYSFYTKDGELAFTINELISEDLEPIIMPYDLGLTTVEYRYLQVGHVRYQNHHQYISYLSLIHI